MENTPDHSSIPPLVPRLAAEMTADEFVDVALHWTETERTVEEFREEFGAPEFKQVFVTESASGRSDTYDVVLIYHCRDQVVKLHVDPDRWEAGYVEIVDVGE